MPTWDALRRQFAARRGFGRGADRRLVRGKAAAGVLRRLVRDDHCDLKVSRVCLTSTDLGDGDAQRDVAAIVVPADDSPVSLVHAVDRATRASYVQDLVPGSGMRAR